MWNGNGSFCHCLAIIAEFLIQRSVGSLTVTISLYALMRVVQNKGSAKGAARTLARTKIDVNGSPTAQFLNVENHGCLASRQYGLFSPTPPGKIHKWILF